MSSLMSSDAGLVGLAAPPPESLNDRLPRVREIELRCWSETYGGDYYGALDVAAEYCNLRKTPRQFPGSWQHGTIPPWHCFRPEVVVYGAPRSMRCFVARADEESFLRSGGYRDVRAVGLPILYTSPSGLPRIPNSLLIMPTHSLASDVLMPSCEQYVSEIASIRHRFDLAVACVSAYCISNNLWVPEFAEHNIPVVRGAGIADGNALRRMRALFDSFEYVTTDSYGSHVFYALYFGCKVSIWGTATPVLKENVLKDGGWEPYPDAVDALFSPDTAQREQSYIGHLRVAPWEAKQDIALGRAMLGHDCVLSPAELRRLFGWTPLRNFAGSAKALARQTLLGRAAARVRRLLKRNRA